MNNTLNVTYASSLTDLCEMNSSFDKGILRIAYHGENRNHSNISKKAFERAIKSMFGCPVVCNYNRETDTLGGHDVEVIKNENGTLSLINVTTPVGCIPESSKYWWDTVEEEDGSEHEYLFAEALLWKRQEAYEKIKRDGITSQSMEISVKDGQMVDGIYHIYDFEFTAFTLIGVEPCFESASISLFSENGVREQYYEMMRDLKESFQSAFQAVKTSNEDDDTYPLNNSTEGGKCELERKIEIAATYGIDIDSLDFSIDELTEEELIQKFEEMKNTAEGEEDKAAEDGENKFELTGNIVEEVIRSVREVKAEREWGVVDRYIYVDCDLEAKEVYCWDSNDWLLYGFSFAEDGDNIIVDFDSKKRKKYAIVDFDEGEQGSPFAEAFNNMESSIVEYSSVAKDLEEANKKIEGMESELNSLREFKAKIDEENEKQARENVFAQFEDLAGIEAFENLKSNCGDMDIATLEEKCYAIRGRNGTSAKFSADGSAPIIKVVGSVLKIDPYGGIFAEYGIDSDNK